MKAAATTRSVMVAAFALGLGLLLLEIAAIWAVQRAVDAHEQVTETRLLVALQTFRPSPTDGRAQLVPRADLDPARSVRTTPAECAPTTLLNTGAGLDGASWTGASGPARLPVTILAVRYADAGAARDALQEKRLALLRCREVTLIFPPYDEPAQVFRSSFDVPGLLVPDRLAYRLTSDRYGYDFYLRRFGNTVTWMYSPDTERSRVGRRVVDDLADRLTALARE